MLSGAALGIGATAANATESHDVPDRPTAVVRVDNMEAHRTVQQYKKDTHATKKEKTPKSRSYTVVDTHIRGNKVSESWKSESGYARTNSPEKKHTDEHRQKPVVKKATHESASGTRKVETSKKEVKTKQKVKSKTGYSERTGHSVETHKRTDESVEAKRVVIKEEPTTPIPTEHKKPEWKKESPKPEWKGHDKEKGNGEDHSHNRHEDKSGHYKNDSKHDGEHEKHEDKKQHGEHKKHETKDTTPVVHSSRGDVFVHNTYVDHRTTINNTKITNVHYETHISHTKPAVKKVYKKYHTHRVYKPVAKPYEAPHHEHRAVVRHHDAPRPVAQRVVYHRPAKADCPPPRVVEKRVPVEKIRYINREVRVQEKLTPMEIKQQQQLDVIMKALGFNSSQLYSNATPDQLKAWVAKTEQNGFISTKPLENGRTYEQMIDSADRTRAERLLLGELMNYDTTLNKSTEYDTVAPEAQQLLRTINALDVTTLKELKGSLPDKVYQVIAKIWIIDHRPEGLDEEVILRQNQAAMEAMVRYTGAMSLNDIPQPVKDELRNIDEMDDTTAKRKYILENKDKIKNAFESMATQ